jgi:microcystin-dependent protein
MSQQYLGEVRIFSFGFPPRGWALCNGQLLSINQNTALFAILGTTYGGNGVSNFALPNLQGQVPIHTGGAINAVLGQTGGEAAHTLAYNEMPMHNHMVATGATADTNTPANGFPANQSVSFYANKTADSTMHHGCIGNVGANQPHQNMAPYLTLNICIAIQGIFPSRN